MKREEILEFIRIVFKGDDELLRVAEEFENAENLDVNSELKEAIEENFEYGIGSVILGYGLNKEIFEYVDWKGEMDTEVTNCLTKYEMSEGLDIFSNSLLDEIDEYEYEEDIVKKIEYANKKILDTGYGIFSYPTESDFFALFVGKLSDKEKLLINIFGDSEDSEVEYII